MHTMTTSLAIERPIEDVFADLADARNNLLWQTKAGLQATQQAPEDLVGGSIQITEIWHWLGRRIEGTSEVTQDESPTKYACHHLLGASPMKAGSW